MEIETIYGKRIIDPADPLAGLKFTALAVAVNRHDVPNIIDTTNGPDLQNFITGARRVRHEMGITTTLPEAAAAMSGYKTADSKLPLIIVGVGVGLGLLWLFSRR